MNKNTLGVNQCIIYKETGKQWCLPTSILVENCY